MCFFFKQKTAYEMRISDWSSDVCSSDLRALFENMSPKLGATMQRMPKSASAHTACSRDEPHPKLRSAINIRACRHGPRFRMKSPRSRSEEHTSELQSLMRISYAVFCLKKKRTSQTSYSTTINLHTH